jgi:hypothetical protein
MWVDFGLRSSIKLPRKLDVKHILHYCSILIFCLNPLLQLDINQFGPLMSKRLNLLDYLKSYMKNWRIIKNWWFGSKGRSETTNLELIMRLDHIGMK